MREGVEAALGVGDLDVLEQLQRARAPRFPRSAFVQRDRLHQLEGDRERRVEARHRVLEDHRDLAAEERAALALAHPLQVAAGEGEPLGADAPGRVDQAEHGERGHALARPRFADDADDLAGGDREADVAPRAACIGRAELDR